MKIEEIVKSFEVIKDINDVMLHNITKYLTSEEIKHGTAIFKEMRKENLIPFSFCGKDMYVESKFDSTDCDTINTIILEWGFVHIDHFKHTNSNRKVSLTDRFVLNNDGSIICNGNKKLTDYSWVEEYVQYALLNMYLPGNN